MGSANFGAEYPRRCAPRGEPTFCKTNEKFIDAKKVELQSLQAQERKPEGGRPADMRYMNTPTTRNDGGNGRFDGGRFDGPGPGRFNGPGPGRFDGPGQGRFDNRGSVSDHDTKLTAVPAPRRANATSIRRPSPPWSTYPPFT
jgi:hypothetical protein